MIQVIICVGNATLIGTAAAQVEDEANSWLAAHPTAKIVASHTSLCSTDSFTDIAVTLIVELPEQPAQAQPRKQKEVQS